MNITEEIKKLKKEKKAIILAHCYQNVEIDEVADYVGDSLYLSQVAAKTDAEIILFAGVYFMAQSAKLLSPNKKVLIPHINAGCAMADMITVQKLREFKAKYPNIPTVCYINSTAEVKAECDICCTSSNAIDIVRSLNVPKVLFVPDNYLGKWVEKQLKNVEIITYNGCCPIHQKITVEDIQKARQKYPNGLILTHPECDEKVSSISDFVGSTKALMEFAKKSNEKQFIIATEKGVADRLNRDNIINNWGKEFILINNSLICESMKMNSLNDIYNSLLKEENEINIDENLAKKARQCIENMLNVCSKK